MTKIQQIVAYLYAQTAEAIHSLKSEAYSATEHEKYAYVSPSDRAGNPSTFRNERPPDAMMEAGWKYAKVKFWRTTSYISPKHANWQQYCHLRRRARRLMVAKLILKHARPGTVISKNEVYVMVVGGYFTSQVRLSSQQKSLAFSAQRYLQKVANKLAKKPERYAAAASWVEEQQQREVAHAA